MNQTPTPPDIDQKYQALCAQLGHNIHQKQKVETAIESIKAQLLELQKEFDAANQTPKQEDEPKKAKAKAKAKK